MQIDRPIAGLLMLRTTASAVVHITRRVSEQTTRLVLHLEADGGVLEEFVSADGFHRFSVPTPAAAVERMARYIDPHEVAGTESGEPVTAPIAELDAAEGEIGERLADTRALSVLTAVSATEASQTTLFATSDALFAMDTPEEGESEATVGEQSASALRELLADVLAPSTRPAAGELRGPRPARRALAGSRPRPQPHAIPPLLDGQRLAGPDGPEERRDEHDQHQQRADEEPGGQPPLPVRLGGADQHRHDVGEAEHQPRREGDGVEG